MYLDFLNNYLTIERFAEDYMLTHTQAIHILDAGKKHNHDSKIGYNMSDYIRTMTKDYNIKLRYKLVPSEKVLDQLAVELNKVTKQYNNHLIDYETFDNLKNLIVAKQNKTITKWQSETGVCFYTGQCLEQIKQDKKDQIAHNKRMVLLEKQRHKQVSKKQPIENSPNKILGLTVTEHCVMWCIILLMLGS